MLGITKNSSIKFLSKFGIAEGSNISNSHTITVLNKKFTIEDK